MTTSNYVNEIEPIPVDWNKRPIIRVYNGKNELVSRSYGQTPEERLKAHQEGKCDMWCDYCYNEALLVNGKFF